MKYLFLHILILIILNISELIAQESKAYVYIFLEEECPICQYYSLDLREIYQEYANQEVSFLGLFPFSNTTKENRSAFSKKYNIPFPLKADDNQVLTKLYSVTVTPEVIVTDTEGKIRYRGRINNAYERPGRRRRVVTSHELKDALEAILARKEVEIKETKPIGCFITLRN